MVVRSHRSTIIAIAVAAAAIVALAAYMLLGIGKPFGPAADSGQPVATTSIYYARTGRVAAYRPARVSSVAVLLSGDGGWSRNMGAFAERLAATGALVLGVDTTRYLSIVDRSRGACRSVAADLQQLSQLAQQRLGLQTYLEPVVIGYSAGSTLAYLAAAQSPASFRGTISLSFAPDLLNEKSFCAAGIVKPRRLADGSGWLYPPTRLKVPWIVIHGSDDRVIPYATSNAFVPKVELARLIGLDGVGHDISDERWWKPFIGAYGEIAGRGSRETLAGSAAIERAVADLPLVEVRGNRAMPGDSFAIFMSGDGGWADLDQSVSAMLADAGVPVVGWSALKYFWAPRTPEGAARDLARVIDSYARAWGRRHVVLVGYSFGADVMPFLVNRLPPATRAKVTGVALIGASTDAVFRFSTLDWFRNSADGLPTAPEILRLDPARTLCIYGTEDKGSVCPRLPEGSARLLGLAGGHHLGGAYGRFIDPIITLASPHRRALAQPLTAAPQARAPASGAPVGPR